MVQSFEAKMFRLSLEPARTVLILVALSYRYFNENDSDSKTSTGSPKIGRPQKNEAHIHARDQRPKWYWHTSIG